VPRQEPGYLSKSRFVTGCQCPKLLWWTVHDPLAEELQPDKVLLDRFDQGRVVGELARERFPGGVLVPPQPRDRAAWCEATRVALDANAPTIFEAAFQANGVFAAIDVLHKADGATTLIEAKSSTSVKEEHVADAAIQAWVLTQAGLRPSNVEIMHLNKEYRHPGQGDLFVRADITEQVHEFMPSVPGRVEEFTRVLEGELPEHAVGIHCYEPRACPFLKRCWPGDPDHISTLYNNGPKKTVEYMGRGIHSIWGIPEGQKLPPAALRQLRALRENRVIVEPGLGRALLAFEGPLGFLDFETVSRAVPVWEGLAPWGQATAQFSYHEERGDGSYRHVGWLAEGPGDPRRELAEAMLEATKSARRIVMYSSFERTRIKELALLLPDLAGALGELVEKLVDLLPVVRDHVYHPGFRGSFSIKYMLNPLVPDLTYNDLVIVDGMVASVEIARLLFVAHKIPVEERDRLRADLLAYCERDTWAMVRLLGRLRELAAGE
jgi:predicted RecB family nuclease